MSWIQERPDLASNLQGAPRTRSSPRRTHTKSKYGCQACKRRRIKCDESYPACGQCRDKSTTCVYTTRPPPPESAATVAKSAIPETTPPSVERQASNSHDAQRTPPGTASSGPTPPQPTPPQPSYGPPTTVPPPGTSPAIDQAPPQEPPQPMPTELAKARIMMHLELVNVPCPRDVAKTGYSRADVPELLDFFDNTTIPWAGSPQCQRVSQAWGLTLAVTNPFLMHGIIAFSASYLKLLRPWEGKYGIAAGLHYGLSLTGFAASLGDSVGRENADALFACCYLHAMLAFHNKTPPSDPDAHDDDFAWLRLMKGIPILQRTNVLRPHLNRSLWLPVFIESGAFSAETGPLPAPPQPQIAALHEIELLRAQCDVRPGEDNDDNPYSTPLVHLDKLSRMNIDSTKIGPLMVFIGRMPEAYVVLLEKLDVRAMKILMYWCDFASKVEQWWCQRPAMEERDRLRRVIGEREAMMTPESLA